MSPNNKKKLIVLRKKLDLLDNQLIKILKKRFKNFKWQKKHTLK